MYVCMYIYDTCSMDIYDTKSTVICPITSQRSVETSAHDTQCARAYHMRGPSPSAAPTNEQCEHANFLITGMITCFTEPIIRMFLFFFLFLTLRDSRLCHRKTTKLINGKTESLKIFVFNQLSKTYNFNVLTYINIILTKIQ